MMPWYKLVALGFFVLVILGVIDFLLWVEW